MLPNEATTFSNLTLSALFKNNFTSHASWRHYIQYNGLLIATLSIKDTRHKQVSLCWVSCFINCYAECRYAECRYAECRYAECRYAECLGALQLTEIRHFRSLPTLPRSTDRWWGTGTTFSWWLGTLLDPLPLLTVRPLLVYFSYSSRKFPKKLLKNISVLLNYWLTVIMCIERWQYRCFT